MSVAAHTSSYPLNNVLTWSRLDTTWREPVVQTSIINAFTLSKDLLLIYGIQLGAMLVCVLLPDLYSPSPTSSCCIARIVIPNRDTWAIDPTVLATSAGEYLVYSSWNGNYQCLYIS
jgi:hypothetical protein